MKLHYQLLLRISSLPCHAVSFLDIFSLSLDRNRPAFRQKIPTLLENPLPPWLKRLSVPSSLGRTSKPSLSYHVCLLQKILSVLPRTSSRSSPVYLSLSVLPRKKIPIGLQLASLQRLLHAPACSTRTSHDLGRNTLLHAVASIWNPKKQTLKITRLKINPFPANVE